jgi:phospholipid/cholesterol/gamma-HCH transport system substrate-binding protein
MITFVLLISDIKTLTSGYTIKFRFNFVNGVKVGAPVRFAGVDVGEVKEIKILFLPEGQSGNVEISGLLRSNVKVPMDSTVWVNTLGLLGEKYIEIMPGKNYAVILKPGESLLGNDPVPMQEITELAKKIASDIEETFDRLLKKEGTIGKLLYDDSIYKELEALVTDLKKHPWKLFWKGKEKPEKK